LLVNEVHQYVKLEDTAYGVRYDSLLKNANQRAVQIEIQNRNALGQVWVKDEWLDLTAELIDQICQGWGRRPDRTFIIAHREADPRKRECPANIDVDNLVVRAQAIWDARNAIQVPVFPDFAKYPPNGYPQATVHKATNVRSSLDVETGENIVEVLPAGAVQDVWRVVEGPEIAGNHWWFEKPNGYYFWTGTTDYDGNGTL
jgi:hypothetical protein